jgi:uracil-DNA glycosylase
MSIFGRGNVAMSSEEILREVAVEVSTCSKCNLCRGRTKAVPGEGIATAKILFIGEGPGFHEDKQGRPFVGPAGQFLDELLASIELRRSDVFITNVVKCRPPSNRDPLPEEIAACDDYLDRQIAALQPQVIVTLGRYSMAKFFGNEKISVIHGRARKKDGYICIAMYHPAAGLHQASLKNTIRDDFKKIPTLVAEAERMAAELPANKAALDKAKDEPPQQLSLF